MNLRTRTPDQRAYRYLRCASICFLLLAAGCDRENIRVYKVAKEKSTAIPTQAPHDHAHGSVAGAKPQLQWELPTGWEEAPLGDMRVASFRIKGENGRQADVGVFPLPGLAGGDLGNVNRWRSQVGLDAIDEAELASITEMARIEGEEAKLYDLAGENPSSGDQTRILAAILHREGVAWFFKVTGDDALVAEHKKGFVGFLESLKFVSPKAEFPPDHPPVSGISAPNTADSPAGAKPAWEVPSGWQEVAGGPFLISKFQINGEDAAQASVNISMSVGDGGGVYANINRWRRQVSLEELPETDLKREVQEIITPSGTALVVQMVGKDPKTSEKTGVVGAVVQQSGRTWFYKLMGNEEVVARQKEAFVGFLKTAKYPNAS